MRTVLVRPFRCHRIAVRRIVNNVRKMTITSRSLKKNIIPTEIHDKTRNHKNNIQTTLIEQKIGLK